MMKWSTPFVNGSKPRPRVGHTFTLMGNGNMVLFGGSQGKTVFGESFNLHLYFKSDRFMLGDVCRSVCDVGDLHILDTKLSAWSEPLLKVNPKFRPLPRYGHSACGVDFKVRTPVFLCFSYSKEYMIGN
jgi:hypothetical protein